MATNQQKNIRFAWVDALKAFAILGILLNHFVEEFGAGPWFSNPSYNWPDLSYRLSHIFPEGQNFLNIGVKFLGWLGDMGPGVFILLSGFSLTLSQLRKEKTVHEFYSSRLKRIFPLYISIHLVVLVFALLVNQPANINLFSPRIILSFLGLRFTDSLFFYINPSWWFIWLILQFYLFFPFLFQLLKKSGTKKFIIITIVITLVSRLAGLINLTYSNNLYYWMTGLFAGTRLAEFTVGMALAYIISSKNTAVKLSYFSGNKVVVFSFIFYITGFVLSWFYFGTLISNIFITIGLSGIFYGIFQVVSKFSFFNKALSIIGKNSFSAFLIHQPFMMYFGEKLEGISKVAVLILIVILSFPIGYLIEKIINKSSQWLIDNAKKYACFISGRFIWILLVSYTFLVIITHTLSLIVQRAVDTYINILSLLYIFSLIVFISASYIHRRKITNVLSLIFLIISVIFYVVLPDDWIPLISTALLTSTLIYILIAFVFRINQKLIITLIITAIFFIVTEAWLRIKKPLETPIWSEYPALQVDKETVYSLTPDKVTHLKYNNYNYVLKTNKMGFACPDIDLSKNDSSVYRIYIVGDAFSMPEGMEYEFSFPYLLEKNLKEKFPNRVVQVVNGGVTGYGPNEMLAQIEKYIDTIQPDLVINEFFVNEFQEINYSPEQRLTSIGFLRQESKRTKLWGYSQFVKHFEILLRDLTHKPDRQYNYNKSLLNLYRKNSTCYADTVVQKIDQYLHQVKKICDKQNTEFLLMYVPGQIEVSSPEHIDFYPSHKNLNDTSEFDFNISHQIINSICKKHNINLLNTKDLLISHKEQPVYFQASWHWNKTGHLLIANVLAEHIVTQFN
jgi:peptidoglycan/LPS O-acetylase OafA/YrhL/lysophospholipase L1-like esterase